MLGMTEVPKPPELASRGGCWFVAGAGAVELHLGVEAEFRPARKAHPGLRVDDISAYAEQLTSRGVPVTWDHALPGRRRFYAEDPVGNRLEFLEAVGRGGPGRGGSGRGL
ncbi:glyoxalase [Streptomyces longisporoflavus]|nr:glyoxalase [Streptomyces longisporoflavus]